MSPAMGWPLPSASKERPSSRMPVPASRMISQPSPVRSSTHGVLPPYRTVEGPGEGMDPRVPQKVSVRLIGLRSHSNLGPLLQGIPVGDGDAASLDADETLFLELLHGSGHRLAARADHLRDRLMRERLLDRAVAGLGREIEQQARDASGDVEQHEPADLLVGTAQPA